MLLVGKESTLECVVFILGGGVIAAYGLRSKKFTESSKLRILTPTNELGRYAPRWYQRLGYIALGVANVIFGILSLCGRI
jgi:hypothetical protein